MGLACREVVGLGGWEAGHADGRERGLEWERDWVRKQRRRLFLEVSSGLGYFHSQESGRNTVPRG